MLRICIGVVACWFAQSADAQSWTSSTEPMSSFATDLATVVRLDASPTLSATGFTLRFDPALIIPISATSTAAGGSCMFPVPGELRCTVASTQPGVPIASSDVILRFRPASQAQATVPLTFEGVSFVSTDGSPLAGTTVPGSLFLGGAFVPGIPNLSTVPANFSSLSLQDVVGGPSATTTVVVTNTGFIGSSPFVRVSGSSVITAFLSPARIEWSADGPVTANLIIACDAPAIGIFSGTAIVGDTRDPDAPNLVFPVTCSATGGAGPEPVPSTGSSTLVLLASLLLACGLLRGSTTHRSTDTLSVA